VRLHGAYITGLQYNTSSLYDSQSGYTRRVKKIPLTFVVDVSAVGANFWMKFYKNKTTTKYYTLSDRHLCFCEKWLIYRPTAFITKSSHFAVTLNWLQANCPVFIENNQRLPNYWTHWSATSMSIKHFSVAKIAKLLHWPRGRSVIKAHCQENTGEMRKRNVFRRWRKADRDGMPCWKSTVKSAEAQDDWWVESRFADHLGKAAT